MELKLAKMYLKENFIWEKVWLFIFCWEKCMNTQLISVNSRIVCYSWAKSNVYCIPDINTPNWRANSASIILCELHEGGTGTGFSQTIPLQHWAAHANSKMCWWNWFYEDYVTRLLGSNTIKKELPDNGHTDKRLVVCAVLHYLITWE